MSVQSPIRDARSLNPSLSNRQERREHFGGINGEIRSAPLSVTPDLIRGPAFFEARKTEAGSRLKAGMTDNAYPGTRTVSPSSAALNRI